MNGPVGVLLDLLFPPKYVFCGRLLTSGERNFCTRYQWELSWLKRLEMEQTGEFFTLCASPLAYRDQIQDSIRRYKFKGRQDYHEACGRLMAQCVHDHLDGRWDPITWMPLSDQRRRERGYNQAFLLANVTTLELGEVAVEMLCKGCNTETQSGLDGNAARRANVLGAYTAVGAELVEGKQVLLINDVITAGATISEYARILHTVGAGGVVCATLARARGQRQGKFMGISVEIGRILRYNIGDYS